MDALFIVIFVVSLLAFLAAGIWIAVSLILAAYLVMWLFSSAPAGEVMAATIWAQSNSWDLAALPMFIWMGEILSRSRLSQEMFRGLSVWIGWLPGRLVHFNVFGSALFAAACGSSAATAVTVGKMSMPELRERGYDESLAIGSLAAASTLGFLIPPSIIFIIYGVAAEQSIARLFIAGIVPGVMLASMLSGYIVIWAILHPKRNPPGGFSWGNAIRTRRIAVTIASALFSASMFFWLAWTGRTGIAEAALYAFVLAICLTFLFVQPMPGGVMIRGVREIARDLLGRVNASRRLIPIMLLISGVLGVIYLGIASATDAAAIGVFLSLVLSWSWGTLNRETFVQSLLGATQLASMLGFMLAGATFLNVSMAFAGIPAELAAWVASMGLNPVMLILVLTIFYTILGCFLDGISIVLLSTSIILPVVEQAGLNPLWFGVYLVMVVELSQLTPPIGVNLFVLQALTKRDLLFVTRATIPFFLVLLLAIAIITLVPQIVTYLPDQMTVRR